VARANGQITASESELSVCAGPEPNSGQADAVLLGDALAA
jgi:hypothetical protein